MTLVSLRVRDLATIADATLELGAGLNVLTGETGAGKSMLVDALALLLGDRSDRAAVRPGANKAVVEGVIDTPPEPAQSLLDGAGIDRAESLIIRREVTSEGRSRAWINGSPTTIGTLAQLGELLVDLHGQHQTIQLLDAATQRRLLDEFARAGDALEAMHHAFDAVQQLRAEHGELASRRDDATRRADWLRHVVREIDAAQIRVGEESALDRDANRLAQAGALTDLAERILHALDHEEEGTHAALGRADRAMQALDRLDGSTGTWRELLDAVYGPLEELSRVVTDYRDALEQDPDRLAQLEQRRDVLHALRRKHGPELSDVAATRDAAQSELDLLDRAAIDLQSIDRRIATAQQLLQQASAALSTLRSSGAERMAREVTRLLPRLGLGGGEFSVQLTSSVEPARDGAEQIVFVVRLNRGMEPKPLARIASGGELSRLMLALKVVLARHDAVPTLVFDEVDQGIGGEVGARVGDALAQVGQRHQVLVITHLPQIAARADRHLRIAKATRSGIATSDVEVLHGEDRVLELARMLGDPDDEAARRMAQGMLNRAAIH